MNDSVFLLYVCNFILVGALPFIFFKKGHKNLRWWLTAFPFFLCALFLIIAYFTQISSFNYLSGWRLQTDLIATLLSVASISLMSYTIGCHKVPLNLWHQNNDYPDHIVTYGPYAKIRHPFYASFLLTLLGSFIFFMHPLTLLTLIYGIIVMQITAVREEKFLLKFDKSYGEYIKKTGRFFPKFLTGKQRYFKNSQENVEDK